MLIGYTLVGTNDMQRALAFYDALFGTIGVNRLIELPTMAGWGVSWDKPIFGVALPYDGGPASPGNGNMVALGARARARVRALHAKAVELGGQDAGAPGLQGAEGAQAFYSAYVRDLDGNKLCFYCVGSSGGD
jgi:catechol 2,3-dioxygenase-like lactoylglutathione lyase family enzyme